MSFTLFALPRTASGARGRLAGAVSVLTHEWALRRARHAMEQLDDAMLHDVGVSRNEIDVAVRHGRAGVA